MLATAFTIGSCEGDKNDGDLGLNSDSTIGGVIDDTTNTPNDAKLVVWSLMDRGDGDDGYFFQSANIINPDFNFEFPNATPPIESMNRFFQIDETTPSFDFGVYHANVVDKDYKINMGITDNPDLTSFFESSFATLNNQAIVYKKLDGDFPEVEIPNQENQLMFDWFESIPNESIVCAECVYNQEGVLNEIKDAECNNLRLEQTELAGASCLNFFLF